MSNEDLIHRIEVLEQQVVTLSSQMAMLLGTPNISDIPWDTIMQNLMQETECVGHITIESEKPDLKLFS